jgi:hypothetical protein
LAPAKRNDVKEKAVLADVEKHGAILVLTDGRRLKILDADDATAASIWFSNARLTLRASKRRRRKDKRDE